MTFLPWVVWHTLKDKIILFCKSKQYLPKHLSWKNTIATHSIMDCLCNLVGIFLILFILAISISSISPKCQYWIKTVFMYIYYLTTAAIVIPFGLVSRNPTKSSNLWALLYRHVSWLVLGLKWNTIGQEHIDKNQTYIVVCNHQTALDVLAASHIWESFERCTLILKKELKYIPILGQCIYLCGAIFLNRGSSESSRNAINEAGKRAKKSGIRKHS